MVLGEKITITAVDKWKSGKFEYSSFFIIIMSVKWSKSLLQNTFHKVQIRLHGFQLNCTISELYCTDSKLAYTVSKLNCIISK